MDSIKRNIDGSIRASISMATAEKLNRYTPKGCPFNGYTLLDLLRDFISAYSWKIARGDTISVNAFIRILQHEGYAHALSYGDDIISLLKVDNNEK